MAGPNQVNLIEYPPPPGRVHGITLAESQQLSCDFFNHPEASELLVVFAGKYVDGRRALGEQFDELEEFQQFDVAENKEVYEEIRAYYSIIGEFRLGGRPYKQHREVGKAALAAAGKTMHEVTQREKALLEAIGEATDKLSLLLAGFCLERLNGRPLVIQGRQFHYEPGYLYREVPRKKAGTKKLPDQSIVYGQHDCLIHRHKVMRKNSKPSEYEKLKISFASHEDWRNLLHGLELITKF